MSSYYYNLLKIEEKLEFKQSTMFVVDSYDVILGDLQWNFVMTYVNKLICMDLTKVRLNGLDQ